MKILRKILINILGFEYYLILISKVFIFLIKLGFFKNKYQELHNLKKIIKKGDTCIDIGANLGYYTHFLLKYVGKSGKVIAIEPIDIFVKVLKKNTSKYNYNNLTIYNVCLGEKKGFVVMATPLENNIIRHGKTRVLSNNFDKLSAYKVYNCKMVKASDLLSNIEKVDYIKIDVEGYELKIIEDLLNIIKKNKPILQIEVAQENKRALFDILIKANFFPHKFDKNKFEKLNENDYLIYEKDIYFLFKDLNE